MTTTEPAAATGHVTTISSAPPRCRPALRPGGHTDTSPGAGANFPTTPHCVHALPSGEVASNPETPAPRAPGRRPANGLASPKLPAPAGAPIPEPVAKPRRRQAIVATIPDALPPAATPAPSAIDGGHLSRAPQWDSAPAIAEGVQLWRMRQRWHRAEKSLALQAQAVCRAWADGDKKAAAGLFSAALAASRKGEAAGDPTLAAALAPFLGAILRFEPERALIEKRLRALATGLPVWPWVAGIKGFGSLNLAAIVGEAGDVGSYRSPACLWKRMGLAVVDGGRQRKVADAAAALEHGYSPRRRSVAFVLGECLIKAGDACVYRPVYADRKVYEAARTATAAHAHNRAARYMTKRALRDLWRAWRAADGRPEDA